MEYYEKDGMIAVLVSPGYGAGWSTWHTDNRIAYDKRVIEYWMDHKNASTTEVSDFMEPIGYPNVYCGGYENLEIHWVPRGVGFYIDEYDGYESLMIEHCMTHLY